MKRGFSLNMTMGLLNCPVTLLRERTVDCQLPIFVVSHNEESTHIRAAGFPGNRQCGSMKFFVFLLLLFESLGICALVSCGEGVEMQEEGINATSHPSTDQK